MFTYGKHVEQKPPDFQPYSLGIDTQSGGRNVPQPSRYPYTGIVGQSVEPPPSFSARRQPLYNHLGLGQESSPALHLSGQPESLTKADYQRENTLPTVTPGQQSYQHLGNEIDYAKRQQLLHKHLTQPQHTVPIKEPMGYLKDYGV